MLSLLPRQGTPERFVRFRTGRLLEVLAWVVGGYVLLIVMVAVLWHSNQIKTGTCNLYNARRQEDLDRIQALQAERQANLDKIETLKASLAKAEKEGANWKLGYQDVLSRRGSLLDSHTGPPPIHCPEEEGLSDDKVLDEVIRRFGSTEESGPGH